VSAGLHGTKSDEQALVARGLPVLHDSQGLAKALGIPLSRLRWLTYHRRGATLVHYHRFEIPKKGGGMRAISAPKPGLAAAQQWVRGAILERLTVEPEAHGFVRERSIVTNATPHARRAVVVNLDVKDFFPSLTFRRVKGLFHSLGYGEHVSTVLALLCTEPPRLGATVDTKLYHVALGERCLPQGACTSPAITNAICRASIVASPDSAARHGFRVHALRRRLTFSGEDAAAVGRLLRSVRAILTEEGLDEHPQKTGSRVADDARRSPASR
jgi:hypothetical protein